MRSEDPLDFFDLRPYSERLAEAEMKTGHGEAIVVGSAAIDGRPVELAVMDFAFMGGSMGSAVGEKFARACDGAASEASRSSRWRRRAAPACRRGSLPHAAAEDRLRRRRSCTTRAAPRSRFAHPTTGGVLASFASLGDVLLAEPGALMSFAGPRVVQQTTREKLPEDFGRPSPTSRTATWTPSFRARSSSHDLARLLRLFGDGE